MNLQGFGTRFLTLAFLAVSMASCSTVRYAINDYQKKYAYSKDATPREAAASAEASTKSAKRALTQTAGNYIGTRYRYGSTDASKGFDCSGLVYNVAKSQQIILPRSSQSMAAIGPHIPWKNAEPGDLIFFGEKNRINHVGIVEKNRGNEIWIIHSTNTSGVIRENILASDYWKKRVLFAMDIIALQPGRT